MADLARQLTIKTKSCIRLRKEMHSYITEAEQQRARIERVKDDMEPERLRQEHENLEETLAMVPDCRKRLEQYIADLKEFLVEHGDDVAGTMEVEMALAVLRECNAELDA